MPSESEPKITYMLVLRHHPGTDSKPRAPRRLEVHIASPMNNGMAVGADKRTLAKLCQITGLEVDDIHLRAACTDQTFFSYSFRMKASSN